MTTLAALLAAAALIRAHLASRRLEQLRRSVQAIDWVVLELEEEREIRAGFRRSAGRECTTEGRRHG